MQVCVAYSCVSKFDETFAWCKILRRLDRVVIVNFESAANFGNDAGSLDGGDGEVWENRHCFVVSGAAGDGR